TGENCRVGRCGRAEATPVGGHASGSRALNIAVQVADLGLGLVDVCLDEVADRHQPGKRVAVHDRQVADALLRHDLHGVIDRIVGHADDQLASHGVAYSEPGKRAVGACKLLYNVAFGYDSHGPVGVIHDQQHTDVVCRERLDCVLKRCVVTDRQDVGPLPAQDVP